MKKKIFILAFLLVSLSMSLIAIGVQAGPIGNSIEDLNSRTKIEYIPNVPIPIEAGGYNFAKKNIVNGGEFLASYIVGIYKYGAGFAGIVAMLMLVIAGWKWLLAGGNAQKVTEAKNMINGVLVGLALLFGGQLLLRQISENFNSIQSLDIKQLPAPVIDPTKVTCDKRSTKEVCDGVAGCSWQDNTCIKEELSCDLTRGFIESGEGALHCCKSVDISGGAKYKYATFSFTNYDSCDLCQEASENWIGVAMQFCVEHLGY